MITHYLLGKNVTWNTIEKVKLKNCVDFYRLTKIGIVRDVTDCGGLLAIQCADNQIFQVETWEVDVVI